MSTRDDGPGPPLDPVLDFMRLLWGIEHRLQSTSKFMEADLGVTGPQRLVLRIVGQSPGLSAGELARTLRLHPSTMTGIVQRLVRKGLLAREEDPSDSRRVRLRVRDKAKPLARRSAGTVEDAVARALNGTSSLQLRHAREVLSSIAAELDSHGAVRKRRGTGNHQRAIQPR
jgi:MarR family transcriptional regulator, organic hydroperoxide resistance regulator